MSHGDLVVELCALGRDLVASGVRLSTGDQLDGLQALLCIDLGDRAELRRALACALKIRPVDRATFDAHFDRHFLGRGAGQPQPGRPPLELEPPRPGRGAPLSPPPRPAGEVVREVDVPDGDQPGASAAAQLRRRPFDQCDERDLARMEPLLARLARQLSTRRARRLRPVPRDGQADLRRSLRRAHATAGEVLWLARRGRPIERPRLVFLCDTSGSMQPHARFLLAFARALGRVAPTTEVFAFNTALTRITPWLHAARLEVVLERLAAAVPDWSGGTRIGDCLADFAAAHLPARVDSRTVILVFSDGLDRGDPERVAGAMRRIAGRARKVIWLNPLLSDPRFEPTARGMAAALPFVDQLALAHDLPSLARLLPELRA